MATIVRVLERDALLTPDGWKTGDAVLDRTIAAATSNASTGGLYDPNSRQAQADHLAAVLRGEVISVDPLESEQEEAGEFVY